MLCGIRLKFWVVPLPLIAVNLQDDAAFESTRCSNADPTPKAGVFGSIELLIDLDRLSGARAPAKATVKFSAGSTLVIGSVPRVRLINAV
jgi:hypothetical protein